MQEKTKDYEERDYEINTGNIKCNEEEREKSRRNEIYTKNM